MKHTRKFAAVAVALGTLWLPGHAQAGDETSTPLAKLEQRIATLEERIAALPIGEPRAVALGGIARRRLELSRRLLTSDNARRVQAHVELAERVIALAEATPRQAVVR